MSHPVDAREPRGGFSAMDALRLVAGAALIAAACGSAGAAANAAGCPAMDGDERLRLIAAAGSCRAAVRINDACAQGTSADTEPTEAVTSLCEKTFRPRLRPPQLRAYQASLAACEKKYADQVGTMYRSLTAYCQEHVAARRAPR